MIPKELDYLYIKKIYKKLTPFVNQTPLLQCTKPIQKLFNTNLYLKLEFFQNSGTFKARGVVNNILNLSQEQKNFACSQPNLIAFSNFVFPVGFRGSLTPEHEARGLTKIKLLTFFIKCFV